MKFTIPSLPPSINHYYGRNGNRTFLKADGLKFRQIVQMTTAIYRNKLLKEQRLSVTIGLYFNNHRRTDIDNRIKSLLDAMMEADILVDDSAIDRLIIVRFYDQEERTTVKIKVI